MNVKKFTASSPREALRKVREALGPDAVILSNRAIDGGVEILALANDDISSLAAPRQDHPGYGEPEMTALPSAMLNSVANAPAAMHAAAPGNASARRPASASAQAGKVSSMAESLEMARRGQHAPAPVANPHHESGYAATLAMQAEFDRGRQWERGDRGDRGGDISAERFLDQERGGERMPERNNERNHYDHYDLAQDSEQYDPLADRHIGPLHAPVPSSQQASAKASKQHARQQAHHSAQDAVNTQAQNLSAATANARHAAAKQADAMSPEMRQMMQEIRAMRGMMETQLAELAWNSTQKREPQKAQILRELLAAGFSPSLSRYLTEKLPSVKDEGEGMRWLKTVLERNILTMKNEHEVLEKGGVFALVGPTGVGKTTSTAKLAARCVMRHGTEKLALITTDGYRIGGHEQLRIYGKILGVMVHSVKDESDLRIALRELRGKHTVLIDTVGVSQRDQMVQEQVAMLSAAGPDVQRLLCLNATSTGETLHEVVRAYQGNGLAGCIMTKLDEAATIGNVLDVVIRQKLHLYYISNGQRVPEDLHLAERGFLIDRAFRSQREAGAFQYQDSELPLIMANSRTADNSLRGVHLG